MTNIQLIEKLSACNDSETLYNIVFDNMVTEHELQRYRNDASIVGRKYELLMLASGHQDVAGESLPQWCCDIANCVSDVTDQSVKVKSDRFNEEVFLSEIIPFLAQNYYNGNELTSDANYDVLVSTLAGINPKNPLSANGLAASDDSGREKIPHALVTGTQAKCKDMEEFREWYTSRPYGKYVLNSKVDGAGVELQYKNGSMCIAISRGDAFYGEDITVSARKWNNLPGSIGNFTGSIRGEFLLKETVFREKYADTMRNARNASAGISKRLDGSGSEDLSFIAYDVLNTANGELDVQFQTEFDKMMWLEQVGFEVPDWCLVDSVSEVDAFRNKIYNARKNSIDYGCDGIVVKQNVIDYDDLKRRTPTTQCAVKFKLDTAVTKLIAIEWSLSGSYLSPVGIVEPVELNETTVQRASLSNLNKMMELGIEIGKMVKIEKRGEIIPKIIEVVQ